LDIPKKIFSHERALVLPPGFDSGKHQVLKRPNGVCTADLTKYLLDSTHKVSEDVSLLISYNASLESQINKLHEKVCQPQV
jgi:hypothetical protein